jgi:CheY-like chemotaxis protein
MDKNYNDPSSLILVVVDVHETRDGIEKLLQADGYRVAVARDEGDAVESARREPPNLILVSLAGSPGQVIFTARQIRDRAGIDEQIPVVVFCIQEICEGDEIALEQNVYVTRPDNFNQLRSLLVRLLNRIRVAA